MADRADGTQDLAKGIAAQLREALRRAVALPDEEQARIIRIVLAYRLRAVERARAKELLESVLLLLTPSARPGTGPGGPDAAALTQLNDAAGLVRAMAPVELREAPLAEIARHIAQTLSRLDSAVETSSRRLLDRILPALDPESERFQKTRKRLQLDAFHKAAVLDQLSKEFRALREEHASGRLVESVRSDFRRSLEAPP